MKLVVNRMSARTSSWFAGLPTELIRHRLSRLSVPTFTLFAMLCLGTMAAYANTFQVTTTADNGNNASPTNGSLRKAILDANAHAGSDLIHFSIAGSGVHTISPPAPLPTISETVTIDGLTQPGAAANTLANGDNAVLLIELDGTNAGAAADGLHLDFFADVSMIRGLVINRFKGNAIYVEAGFSKLEGNFIGTDPTGTIVRGNGTDNAQSGGIRISGINNVVGGTTPAARNVVAGSMGGENYGIGIVNAVSPGQNIVAGNFVGTDKTGLVKLGNATGVLIRASLDNTIGGTVAGSANLISGNLRGVALALGANDNRVLGNLIGVDANGLNALGNAYGVIIQQHSEGNLIGGTVSGSGNVIAFNTESGIFQSDTSKNNSFLGNSIFSNQKDGIALGGDVQLSAPSIDSAKWDAAGTKVQGTLKGTANTQFRIEFFVNPACDASGFGEGKTFIGSTNVQTNSNGDTNIASTFNGLSKGSFITTTATDFSGNTSQFSNCQIVQETIPQISINDVTMAEGNSGTTKFDFTLSLTPASGQAVKVNYATGNNSALASSDYQAAGGVVTFSPGQTSVGITVLVNGDTQVEPNETFVVNLSNAINATIARSAGVGTIVNDDTAQPGTLAFSAASYNANENGGQVTITVTRTGGSNSAVSIQYATSNGTATAGSDYTSTTGTLNWADGDASSKTLVVPITNDSSTEADETVNLTLSNPGGGATLGSPSSAVLTIVDDDSNSSSPTIQFSQATYSVPEDLGAMTVTVTRSGDTSGAASIDYTTSDGSAIQKADFEYAAGTLTFAAGETSKTITILLNEDVLAEGNETFNLTLSNPAGAVLGAQSSTTVTIVDDLAESMLSPVDDAQSFVYMHYHDFLNREPDAAGLQFWTSQITACGTDAKCIDGARVNVSASFFLSIEFQETAYLLYLMQKESYSTMPKYALFMRDLQEVSRGVVVNAPGWQQKLADNQQQFADKWSNRAEFKAAYDALSNDAYVNALYKNAGIVAPQTEKDKLVGALNAASMNRSAVLLAVAGDATFRQQEANGAFVLMEYFGYLRRDANASPDTDLSGYNFWLIKLNQFNGNYVDAEMIKAFITSFEYRQRFGN